MSESDPKLDKNIFLFPDNIGQFNNSCVNPMSPRYSPRRTRFGDSIQDSGSRTPPLWKTSPKRNHQYYETLSPNSRTREIAKGRMEMVRDMPESCYELSLTDLVEKTTLTDQENGPEHGETVSRSGSSKRQNSVRKKKYEAVRSGSIRNGGGFLLKMGFPVSSSPAKVSPRPSMDGSAKGLGMDWLKKKGSGSEDDKKEEYYDKSIGIISSRRRRGRKGCWPLMRIKRSKSPK